MTDMFLKNLPHQPFSRFKQTIFILQFFVFGCLLQYSSGLYAENQGFKYSRNYSYKEYDHLPQNWGMAQAKNGIIYAANHGGVLEYDGVSWRVIYLPDHTLRSLTIDEKGTIFMGGMNEIWYLAPDSTGSLKYVSLLDQLQDEYKNFNRVWSTHANQSGVYFRTSKFLFHWNYKEMKVFKPSDSANTSNVFKASFVYNGELIIQEAKQGLLKVVKDSLQPIPGGKAFAGEKIFMLVPFENNIKSQTLIIGTRESGFFLYDGKAAQPFTLEQEVERYLEKNKLTHGIRLYSGDFALATRGGLIIMDRKGRLKSVFDKSSGLLDDLIYNVFQDVRGNIWLCLGNGIAKIEYKSPLSIYDDRSNLPGLAVSVVKHHNKLYVGTTKGLYYLESFSKFTPVPGISGCCWSLASNRDSVLAAADNGIFQVKNGSIQRVGQGPAYVLLISKHYPGHIWCGTPENFILLTLKDGQWKEKIRIDSGNRRIGSMTEDENGNLWLGTLNGRVFKVTFPDDIAQPVLNLYDSSHGLPEKEIFVAYAAEHVIFATTKGLFRFDREKNTFIPDETLGLKFTGGLNSNPIFRIVEDKGKHIWFNSESRNSQAIPYKRNSFQIYTQPFRRIPLIQVNAIYPDPDGKVIWFASNEGLIRYDKTVKKNYRQPFKTLIRRVVINEKQENQRNIFGGSSIPVDEKNKGAYQIFEYDDRNILFEFAAPFFEAEAETQYQYLLQGYDEKWSTWSKDPKKYYTNLNPGRYSFRVRARNVYRHQGEEDVFKFKILPPWYLAWWAFLFYGAAFLMLMFLVVKWRSYRLELQTQKLELIIKERTKEIQQKNRQLKEQSEKLKEMDKVKSRFFANLSHTFRTPLTLIMSPLDNMISRSRDKKQKRELNTMLRNSQWLLTLINQLLDLARFDSKEEKLRAACQNIVSFLKTVIEPFQVLARQNKLDLVFFSEEKEIDLYFEPSKMEDVMGNLLMNAIKFTPPGGKITVSLSRGQQKTTGKNTEPIECVNISVRDTGTGISREQMTHIFDRFYQAGGMKENLHKGTGIGLAVADEIIKLHHGVIDVHSQEGEGTEFVIRIPLGNKHLEPGEVVFRSEAVPAGKKAKEIETLYMRTDDEDEETNGNETARETDKKNRNREKNIILVVEDYEDVRKYIRGPLVEAGYEVVEAVDGKEGIDRAREIIPDLIISDIMMPEKDGYELCKALKKDFNTSHIPIIILTAKGSDDSKIEGLETGADDYVTKPFNTRMLLTRIKNLIDLRRQMQLKIQRQKMLLPMEVSVSNMDENFLKELQDIIEKNISDSELDIDMLLKKLCISRTTLFRKVQALTGETPIQFIKSYRLERAAKLLRKNFGNITEVAMEVGFSTPQHFSQCFREKFHQSPSSFKASESA